VDPARLVLVEFNPIFCRLLRSRYPAATVVQGDAYRLKHLLGSLMREPAAAVVSGLPLFTKPLRTRLRLISEAFGLLLPSAPFIQFTYAVLSPIPKTLPGMQARSGERIWLNLPPAQVWVYRKGCRRSLMVCIGVLEPPMLDPKILVFAGSIRTGSHNARLAALAVK